MSKRWEQIESNVGADTANKSDNELEVVVIFTTVRETLSALREASALALQLGVRTRIIVPHVVPYPLPVEQPPGDPGIRVRMLETACEAEGIETSIEIRLCRRALEAVKNTLMPGSVVLIGGRERWLSRAGRLAKELRRSNHHVLFIPSSEARYVGGASFGTVIDPGLKPG